ncbi:MAG: hypothetical protein GDA68_09585 [Nitrospira sp. CR2.1]|nr:hypothetical protein [Nitrospira sp. CR2.1]
MKRVVVNIDRLVLEGVRFEDRHAIAQGLQEQLTRLLADPRMAEQIGATGSTSRLRLGQVRVTGDIRGPQIGQVTGRAIADHWSQGSREKRPGTSDPETGQGRSSR